MDRRELALFCTLGSGKLALFREIDPEPPTANLRIGFVLHTGVLGSGRRGLGDGTLEEWNNGMMERWNTGTIEYWNGAGCHAYARVSMSSLLTICHCRLPTLIPRHSFYEYHTLDALRRQVKSWQCRDFSWSLGCDGKPLL